MVWPDPRIRIVSWIQIRRKFSESWASVCKGILAAGKGLPAVIREDHLGEKHFMRKLTKKFIKRSFPFLLLFLFLTGCGKAEEEISYQQISMEEAVVMMEEESDYIILDVRTPEEYEAKHIPGAVNVPNETIGSDPILQLPDKDQRILVYCRSGNRSKQSAQKLADQGYTNVVEFGGINDWTGEIGRAHV